MPNDQELDTLFQSLADPTRRAILSRLSAGPATVTDLAAPFGMALPSVLQHLRRLEDGGLIETTKQGRVRTCALRPGALAPARSWMEEQRLLWEDRTDRLEAYLATLQESPPMPDLSFSRVFRAPRATVWECWTNPDHFRKWFTPPPAETTEVILEPRPGGRFFTVIRYMGQDMPGDGVVLEAVPGERLVFTNLLMQGWKPAATVDLPFTAIIELSDHDGGTLYRVTARHPDDETARRHEEMGFTQGWGTAADQLGRLAESLR